MKPQDNVWVSNEAMGTHVSFRALLLSWLPQTESSLVGYSLCSFPNPSCGRHSLPIILFYSTWQWLFYWFWKTLITNKHLNNFCSIVFIRLDPRKCWAKYYFVCRCSLSPHITLSHIPFCFAYYFQAYAVQASLQVALVFLVWHF